MTFSRRAQGISQAAGLRTTTGVGEWGRVSPPPSAVPLPFLSFPNQMELQKDSVCFYTSLCVQMKSSSFKLYQCSH
jgi:hypothetical protein